MKYNVFVWPVVVLREALKKKNLYYVYKSNSGEAGVKLRSGWVKPENLPREKKKNTTETWEGLTFFNEKNLNSKTKFRKKKRGSI